MGKKLAIKGHSTRGKEVIELFKMMGGCECGYCGGGTGFYYYISQFGNIEASCKPYEFDTYIVYTLEEFLEKFPYKVGDKVYIYIQNDDIDGRYDIEVAEIISMRWNPARCKIAYKMKDINREFYKEEIKCKVDDSIDASQFMQIGKTVAVCFNTENYENEVELQLGDYEIEVRNGKTYAVRKKYKYPTTYEECFNEHTTQNTLSLLANKTNALYNLLICCRAYWKIAGKEMGLDKPWEPDFTNDDEEKYGIYTAANKVVKDFCGVGDVNTILTFPTEEMRDAFYENFKDLIEQCKELL